MKSIFLAFIVAAFFIAACNRSVNSTGNSGSDSTVNSKTDSGKVNLAGHNDHPAGHHDHTADTAANVKGGDATGNTGKEVAGASLVNASFKKLLSDYFKLKNALAADEANNAAAAGQAIVTDFDHFDQSALNAAQKKTYTEIAEDAREMAEHIGKSADRIPHQREHFDMLSKDMYDMVKLFGAGQPVYIDHCPMYNNRKGAIWLSEIKSIKNPYFGKSMPDCGSLKEELK